MRAVDRECVGAGPEPDAQLLEAEVADRDLELEAGQRSRGQRAGLVRNGRVRIVDVQDVSAGAAVHRQQAIDVVDRSNLVVRSRRHERRVAAHVDGVVIRAAANSRPRRSWRGR